MIRHDRTVIDRYGGPWPEIADKVRDSATLAVTLANPRDERAAAIRRRLALLGLSLREFERLCGGINRDHLSQALTGAQKRSAAWWGRVERALAEAEANAPFLSA